MIVGSCLCTCNVPCTYVRMYINMCTMCVCICTVVALVNVWVLCVCLRMDLLRVWLLQAAATVCLHWRWNDLCLYVTCVNTGMVLYTSVSYYTGL